MRYGVFQKTKELQFSYIEEQSNWNMTCTHYHDGFELYLQTTGTREIFFRDKQYFLKPNTLCLITPHILHLTKCVNENELFGRHLINFSPEIFNGFLNENEINSFLGELYPLIIELSDENMAVILSHISNIYTYWNMQLNNIPRGKKLAYIEIYRLLDYLIRLINSSPDILILENNSSVSDTPIFEVLNYIELHYFEEITLCDALNISHMSKSSFYRSFRQVTGEAFNQYINKLRIVKAHKLITDTKLTLQKIAEKTGFSSTAHMTRLFREMHGVSPSEYRRKNKYGALPGAGE